MQLLSNEQNIVRVNGTVAVIGDIHGQLWDLINIHRNLEANQRNFDKFLFLGDYVDRGVYGPEVMVYVCALKIGRPNDVTLLRGNHETREVTMSFNFYK